MRGGAVLVMLLAASTAALGETLASANFKVDVAATVAGAAAGANFRVCAGTGCMAVPPPVVVAPGNPAAPGGGGGGGGGPEPTPLAAGPPLPETAPAPSPVARTVPEPIPAESAFVPPLPMSDRSPAPAAGPAPPWPVAAVAAAGALAALFLMRGAAARAPGAAAGKKGEEVAVAPGTEVIGGNCPFCGDLIKGSGLIVPCPSCRAVHHSDCWRENGGCTTLGCARVPARPEAAEEAG